MIKKNELKNIDGIKMLILDIDGTLVKFTNLKILMQDVLKDMKIAYKDELFLRYTKSVSELLKKSENDLSFNFQNLCNHIKNNNVIPNEKLIPTFLSNMIDREPNYVEECVGAKEFLDKAKHKYSIVCSTNWFLSSQKRKLEQFGMDKDISKIYCCENIVSKPNKHHYLHILNEEIVRPEEAIMIGDSITDIPPKDLKLQSIIYDPTESKDRIYENATCVITNLNDLEIIFSLSKGKDKSKYKEQ